jgi:hypothetical protein
MNYFSEYMEINYDAVQHCDENNVKQKIMTLRFCSTSHTKLHFYLK